jgi:TPR repeat protein
MRVWGPFVLIVLLASVFAGSAVALLEAPDVGFWMSASDASRRGDVAFARKDYATALGWYQKAAFREHAPAEAQIGFMHRTGIGVAQSDTEAVYWYRKAAEHGNRNAQHDLGLFYETGRGGLAKDDKEAARFYRLAADQGDPRAQTSLGYLYEYGRGLPKSDGDAARLYRRAADQGDAAAQNNLAIFYVYGRGGLPKNEQEAARLYNWQQIEVMLPRSPIWLLSIATAAEE